MPFLSSMCVSLRFKTSFLSSLIEIFPSIVNLDFMPLLWNENMSTWKRWRHCAWADGHKKKTYVNTFTKENIIDDIVHKWMHARNQSAHAYALIETSHITLSASRCMQDKNTRKHIHKRKHYKWHHCNNRFTQENNMHVVIQLMFIYFPLYGIPPLQRI